MSEAYSPNDPIGSDDLFETIFLSHRDLGLQIPINYATVPGVSLTAACFSNGRYEDARLQACFSNLLALYYRRFVVDLYWDQNSSVWSLCPAEIPRSNPMAPNATSNNNRATSSVLTTAIYANLNARQAIKELMKSSPTKPIATIPHPALSTNSLGSQLTSIATSSHAIGSSIHSIGPYVCTETMNLSALTSILYDYIQDTQNDLAAHLLYLTINLHATRSFSSPSAPAPAPISLPVSSNLLSSVIAANLSAYLYTPQDLHSDRKNLNYSWYEVSEKFRPVETYYKTSKSATGIISTDDGWPTEYYIEFSQRKRLIVNFGTVDTQMSNYSVTDDSDRIFDLNFLRSNDRQISLSASKRLDRLCLINSTSQLGDMNASWAITATSFPGLDTTDSNLFQILDVGSSLSACGISTILNTTLLNRTADVEYIPYQKFSYSNIWSWAPGQPKDDSERNGDSDSLFRCATISLEDVDGRWVVSDCSMKYFSACRSKKQPFDWYISDYPVSYSYAPRSCPDGYTFAAPRTALENRGLNQIIAHSKRDFDNHGPWIDLNSLDESGCWVANNGPGAQCPYTASARMDDFRTRYVLLPAIAALVVLFLTAVLIFGKLAENKKVRKRTRNRNREVYESIPA